MTDIFIDLTNLTINPNPPGNTDIDNEYEISDIESNSAINNSIISIKKQSSRGDIKRNKQRPLLMKKRFNTMESEYIIRLRNTIENLQIKLAHYEDIIKYKDKIIVDQRQIIQRQSKEIFTRNDKLEILEETVAQLRINSNVTID
jgi:hypothetical protein